MNRLALLSVYDKQGVVGLAAGLSDLGWDLLSSGDTAQVLRNAGIAITEVSDHTGSPAMLGHRVVTLHPKIHGGILADRGNPDHMAELEDYGIAPIDLVVVNLYPFASQPGIEMIDIGGPALVRAAAKNHAHVGVVVDPDDYEVVLDELRANDRLSDATRRDLARTAFARTAAYDGAVVDWLDASEDEPMLLPPTLHLTLERADLTAIRREPPPAGRSISPHHGRQLVGPHRTAGRGSPQLPQPARRRGCLAART